MSTIKLLTLGADWDVRVGPVDYALPYSKAACTEIPGTNQIKLAMLHSGPRWYSAGLLGPQATEGLWEFIVRCRLGALDPNVVFSLWFHNENGMELDVFEASYWGDPNAPMNLSSTCFNEGAVVRNKLFYSAQGFNRFKFVCRLLPDQYQLLAYGDQSANNAGNWIPLMTGFNGSLPGHIGQLRAGLYIPKTGFYYAQDALARGPLSAVIESVTHTPF